MEPLRSISRFFIGICLSCISFSNLVYAQSDYHLTEDLYYKSTDAPPLFAMDLTELINEIMEYPGEAMKTNIAGTVICQFTITEQGLVTDHKIEKGVHNLLDQEALRIIRHITTAQPAKKENKRLEQTYTLPVTFSMQEYVDYQEEKREKERKIKEASKNMIICTPHIYPQFPGGDKTLLDFINDNKQYPETLEGSGIYGRVICSFTIGITGQIYDIHIIREVHPELDKAAIRVIESIPDWIPGKSLDRQLGIWKYISVKYTIPVNFKKTEE